MPTVTTFFTVIVLHIDLFESTIVDERHFGSHAEAQAFAKRSTEHAIVIQVQ